MLHWLEKSLADLPAGVPRNWAEAAARKLQSMEHGPAGSEPEDFPEKIFEFVLHGGSENVFDRLRDIRRRRYMRFFNGYSRDPDTDALYADFDQVPTEVALRWAKAMQVIWENQATSGFDYCFDLPSPLAWVEVIFMQASGTQPNVWPLGSAQPLRHATLARLLAAAGEDPALLLVQAFRGKAGQGSDRHRLVTLMCDFAQALDQHLESVRPHLSPEGTPLREHVLELLKSAELRTLDRIPEELVALAGVAAKAVRSRAEELIANCGASILPPLRMAATRGNPEQRQRALRLLFAHARRTGDAPLEEFARATARADKGATVRALEGEWDAASASAEVPPPAPETTVIDWSRGYTAQTESMLDDFVKSHDQAAATANRQRQAQNERNAAAGYQHRARILEAFSPGLRASLVERLRDPVPVKRGKGLDVPYVKDFVFGEPVRALGSHTGVTPESLFKIIFYLGFLCEGEPARLSRNATAAFNALHARTGRPTLAELARMLEDSGFDSSGLVFNYCATYDPHFARSWPDDAVGPFFARHTTLLATKLRVVEERDYSFDRRKLFKAIGTLPTLGAELADPLIDLALGTSKTERPLAQAALARYPRRRERILTALGDGRAEVRAVAAQWAGEIGDASIIPALAAAFEREKQDVTRGALLDALDRLGEPVEKYLDRDALAAEARKAAAKPLPKELGWLPWESLPPLRWASNDEPVPVEMPRWMLAMACRAKSPEPNAMLRKYCALFEPRGREQFGQWLLENWLRHDVVPVSPEVGQEKAHQFAVAMHQMIATYPQYSQDNPYLGKSVAEIEALALPTFLKQPGGSAIGSKGILAVVAACAGERAAAPVQRYIKEWFGSRAAQGKALIAMLAWIEHPSATQLMLAIGNRFRTRSFQDEALRCAQELAERRGWTLAELADRTMPSAGFDDEGQLPLSYGQREFMAKLLPDFSIELRNPDGNRIAALPEPRQDDDAQIAGESKKALSAARKEIKTIVQLQTDRLYEALCTGRSWSFGDWRTHLQSHPVVKHLLQRLVWRADVADAGARLFRPLDDGTLTDVDDAALTLPDEARVQLAHDSLLGADQVGRWQQHLLDYEIKPPFQQLGKGTYTLPDAKASVTAIEDFKGHMVQAFALRARATRLGYARGPAEDAGWFYEYRKRFPTLALEASLRFTGNGLPEENRDVALETMTFARIGAESTGNLRLGDIPAVLLSECYNDMRLIAAEGTGFDAEWESKTG